MRTEISDTAYDLAYDKASPEIVLFISDINDGDVLVNALKNFKISELDAKQIKREVVYIALGLAKRDEFLDNVLLNTEGDEEVISFAVDFIDKNILAEIADILPTNQDAPNLVLPANVSAQRHDLPRTSADILLKEIGVHNAPGHEHDEYTSHGEGSENLRGYMPSKRELLDEIEKPTETVNKPEFALPKTKPGTAEILKNVASTPYTLADTAKISDGEHSTTIIDPFRKIRADEKAQTPEQAPAELTPAKTPEIESTIISSSDPVLVPETTPADQIKDNLDKKLTSVTGSTASESYKIASHDPYREPIEP